MNENVQPFFNDSSFSIDEPIPVETSTFSFFGKDNRLADKTKYAAEKLLKETRIDISRI